MLIVIDTCLAIIVTARPAARGKQLLDKSSDGGKDSSTPLSVTTLYNCPIPTVGVGSYI